MSQEKRIVVGLVTILLVSPISAEAGFFSWNNPSGGVWETSSNWQSNTYPRYFWDFASFGITGSYEVDATQSAPISVALIDVAQGNVRLKTASALGGKLIIQASASLELTQGVIRSTDGHQVGGQMVVGQGATLIGGSNRTYAVEVANGGTLFGNGTVDGNWTRNLGSVSAGDGPGGIGMLTLGSGAGGLDQHSGAVLVTELSAAGFDQVVSLNTNLAGHLDVVLLDGYVPQAGEEFTILTSATPIQGVFESVAWPDGADFDLLYHGDRVSVVVTRVWTQAAIVSMDIKPGSCPNPLNTQSRGVLPVALMFSPETDLEGLDPADVSLAGIPAFRIGLEDVSSPVGSACGCEERGPDGVLDVVLKFDTQAVVAALGEVVDGQEVALELTGILPDGTTFSAQDCVRLLVKGKKKGGRFAQGVDSSGIDVWQDSDAGTVHFRMPRAGQVRITVLDVQGRQVQVLAEDFYASGEHALPNLERVAGGVYFYRLQTELGIVTKKVMQLR